MRRISRIKRTSSWPLFTMLLNTLFNTKNIFRGFYRNNSSLLIVEHDSSCPKSSLGNLIFAAKKFSNTIECIVCDFNSKNIALKISNTYPVNSCIYVNHENSKKLTIEQHSELISHYIKENKHITHVMAASTNFGKSLIPRISGKFLCSPISDVNEIMSHDTFKRSMYAGNVLVEVRSKDHIKFMTILPTSFESEPEKFLNVEVIEKIYEAPTKQKSEWIENKLTTSELPDLLSANIVVSGGRGLKNKQNFELIYNLAKKLKAAVGASRTVVDSGIISNDHQIGQTGKIVAPHLYIAVAISGAIQHVAGMKDSKIIVSINKDPDSPINSSKIYFVLANNWILDYDIFKFLKKPPLTIYLK